jgi:hypothetical protein
MGTDKTAFVQVVRGGATGNHLTGSDAITGSVFCACPAFCGAFFLTIVVVHTNAVLSVPIYY